MSVLAHVLRLLVVLELLAVPAQCQDGLALPRAARDGYSFGFGVWNFREEWTYGNQVDNTMIFFEGSRGITDHLEVFGRVGWSNIVINEGLYMPINATSGDLSPNAFTPFVAAGVRYELFTHERFALGAAFSAAFHSEFTENVNEGTNVYHRVWIQGISEYSGTLTGVVPYGSALFYFGPTLHFAYLDGVTEQFEVTAGGTNISRRILAIRDKGSVAGVFGVDVPINDIPVVAEIRAGDSVSGGVSIYKTW